MSGGNHVDLLFSLRVLGAFLNQDVEVQHEQLKETHGKMDELNSILSVTQQRLNKFKVVGGTLWLYVCC